ncbi:MAG: hypothetical protein ABS53_09110 [Hydrogenophaga sp. SCN 70-13]|nr:MAG: hypothetical protein ABS53_09110 [Hydrogenophaga sp. SCN 70-13]
MDIGGHRLRQLERRLDDLLQVVWPLRRKTFAHDLLGELSVVHEQVHDIWQAPNRLYQPKNQQGLVRRESINVVDDDQEASRLLGERFRKFRMQLFYSLFLLDQPTEPFHGTAGHTPDTASASKVCRAAQDRSGLEETSPKLWKRLLQFLPQRR